MKHLNENSTDLISKVATIGFFDGVHTGHDFLLNTLKNVSFHRNMKSMVVTFSNHPRLLFQPDCGLLQLTLSDEKLDLIESKKLDYSLLLNFTYELAALTSYQFMHMLSDKYGVKILIIGYDHHFGSDKNSSFDQYVEFGKNLGIEVIRCDQHSEFDLIVSSSKIRHSLDHWNIDLANKLLGYNYIIKGEVVHGKHLGHTIGFPTANLSVDKLKILPAQGVYSVKVYISSDIYSGILNIGTCPTVNGTERTVEVHIIGFNGDLYGRIIKLEFIKFIRHEQKFSNIEALKKQIESDIESI